jgi:hypothetical protein
VSLWSPFGSYWSRVAAPSTVAGCSHIVSTAKRNMLRRYGPHRGDYMFHCHNLVHEDDDMLRAFSVSKAPEKATPAIKEPFTSLNRKGRLIYSNWGYNNPLYGQTNARLYWKWPKIDKRYIEDQVRTCAWVAGGHLALVAIRC